MKTIWKYELKIIDKEILSMPKNAEILCVQNQHGSTFLWAIVDTKAEKENRSIEIFGTGSPIPVDMGIDRKYISTFQLQDGCLVFHAFEQLKNKEINNEELVKKRLEIIEKIRDDIDSINNDWSDPRGKAKKIQGLCDELAVLL